MKRKPPAPGSDEAKRAGCTCPVLDNSMGGGWMQSGNLFVVRLDCPLHGKPAPAATGKGAAGDS